MKLLLIVALFAGLASAQYGRPRFQQQRFGPTRYGPPQFGPPRFGPPRFGPNRFFSSQQFGHFQQRPHFQSRPFGQPHGNTLQKGGGDLVHNTHGGSQYHYSWRRGASSFTGGQAAGYCNGLGHGWRAISINNAAEDNLVAKALLSEGQKYTWTGASGRKGVFVWNDGTPVQYSNWSPTGGAGRRQPDNREGNEDCLAVLNNFYGDGVKWHDIACSHKKPIICERSG